MGSQIPLFQHNNMSSRAPSSTGSQPSSAPSPRIMASVATHQSSHPFLTPAHASNISTWASSLPRHQSYSSPQSESEAQSREAAIEAYRQLKAALFSKAMDPSMPRPT